MKDKFNRADLPLWVRSAFWGISSRRYAMLWFQGAAFFAGLVMLFAIANGVRSSNSPTVEAMKVLFAAAPWALIAAWIWLAIKFVDDNGGWKDGAKQTD